jgi:restriction system protein
MKFEMAQNSLFAILLRKPWWVSAAIAAGLLALARFMLPPQWFFYGASVSLPFIVLAGMTGWKALKAPSGARVADTLDAVRAMGWPEFSTALETAWQRDGWTVTRIGDTGADFELTQGWRRAVLSGKRWKSARTGVEPLRELHGVRERREVQDGIYVATGEVTEQALKFAQANRIRIVGGPELARMLPELGAKKGLKRFLG